MDYFIVEFCVLQNRRKSHTQLSQTHYLTWIKVPNIGFCVARYILKVFSWSIKLSAHQRLLHVIFTLLLLRCFYTAGLQYSSFQPRRYKKISWCLYFNLGGYVHKFRYEDNRNKYPIDKYFSNGDHIDPFWSLGYESTRAPDEGGG